MRRLRPQAWPCGVVALLLLGLATGSLSAQTGKEQELAPRHTLEIGDRVYFDDLALSVDGQTLAVAIHNGEGRGELMIFDAQQGKERTTLPTRARVRGMAISGDGRRLVALGQIGGQFTLERWDLTAPRQTASNLLTQVREPQQYFLEWLIQRPQLNYDGSLVALADGQGHHSGFQVWRTDSGQLVAEQLGVHAVATAFSPDGRYLAYATLDGEVRRWNLASNSAAEPVATHTARRSTGLNQIKALRFDPTGRILLVVTATESVAFDTTTRQRLSAKPHSWSQHPLVASLAIGVHPASAGDDALALVRRPVAAGGIGRFIVLSESGARELSGVERLGLAPVVTFAGNLTWAALAGEGRLLLFQLPQ